MKKLVSLLIVCGLVFTSGLLPEENPKAAKNAAPTGEVVFNEIAWVGTTYSSADEWMELYNTTGASINLSGWSLNATDGTPSISLSGTIPAGGFFLLERTDDGSVPGVNADKIYTGALVDSGEVLELRDSAGTLIDTVNAWHAGSVSARATMEKIDPLASSTDSANWNTSSTTYDGGFGTPKTLNSNTGSGGDGGSPGTGNLQIHHINIGQGDSTLVIGPTGKTMLLDAGESYWNSSIDAQKIGSYIESVTGSKHLDYVVISHFQVDHVGYVGYGGLWHLVEQQGFTVGKMIHRDYSNYLGTTSGTFDNWKEYLEGPGKAKLNPVIAVEGTSQIDLGGNTIVDIVAIDGNHSLKMGNFSNDPAPPSENDYSIGVTIKYGTFDEWVGGDLSGQYYESAYGYKYHDIELSAAKEVGDVDIYRVNHHGSDHSSSPTFVNQLDPEVSVISVGDANTYGHPRQSVMDLLLATSNVYLTERGEPTTNIGNAVVGGDIVVTTDGTTYTVNGKSYTSTDPIRPDSDGDGYFDEVDPNDSNPGVIPDYYGGFDPVYQQ